METLGSRVTRLITGSLHAIVDVAENVSPQFVMQESIREIGSAIHDIRKELGKSELKKKNIQDAIATDEKKHTALLEQIQLAIGQDREDLAEAGISKQMDLEAQTSVLGTALKDVNAEIKKYNEYIVALQAKKREMQEEAERQVKNTKMQQSKTTIEATVSKADEAFTRVNGHIPNVSEIENSEEEAKLEELSILERKHRIKTRLDAMKTTQNTEG